MLPCLYRTDYQVLLPGEKKNKYTKLTCDGRKEKFIQVISVEEVFFYLAITNEKESADMYQTIKNDYIRSISLFSPLVDALS